MDTTNQQPYSHVVPMRLQKFLARAGAASRRGSENLMTAGRVKVNGVVTTELGSKVDPRIDTVTVDDIEVRLEDQPVYLMLYKPDGYVTTMSDPHGRPCVADLVPTDIHPALYPVGRLDMDTTGLLFFTTDGSMGQKCLHPSRHVNKRYIALVTGRISKEALNKLRSGITLDDGPCVPTQARILSFDDTEAQSVLMAGAHDGSHSVVELIIHEGRKRQVKRMLDAVGFPVLRLHRPDFGPLHLSNVDYGKWRYLTPSEIIAMQAL